MIAGAALVVATALACPRPATLTDCEAAVGDYKFEPNGIYAYPANHQGCARLAVAGHYSLEENVAFMTMENCGPIACGAPGVDEPISFVVPHDFVVQGRYAYHRQS